MVGDVVALDVVMDGPRDFGHTERMAVSLIRAHDGPRVVVDLSYVESCLVLLGSEFP